MAQIIEINDLNAPELEIYAGIKGAQLKKIGDEGSFIAESIKVIGYALDAGYEPVSLLMERRCIDAAAAGIIERCGEIPVYTASRETLSQLTGFELTRGILCRMRRKPLLSAEEVCSGARRVAVLEDIADPTNVGALFRSAAALGFDAILLTQNCCDALYRRAVRVSMGTVFQIPWTRVGENWMDELHALSFKTAAMALRKDALKIDDKRLSVEPRLALILGSEGYGLNNETIGKSDYTVIIPMAHGVDSLNVAAAGAVAFWQLGNK